MSQNNLLIYIVIGVGGIIIALVLIFTGILPGLQQSSPDPVTLTFWGFREDKKAWESVIGLFKEEYPYVDVKYEQLDESTYESLLVNRLAENRGPDIFLLKNAWVIEHQKKIFPFPKEALQFSTIDFKNAFVDGAADNLISGDGAILGLPVFIDSLALFYNKDVFNTEGITVPPGTWDEVITTARRLTTFTPSGDIVRSGIALGAAQNIERSFEIVSALLLQQNGGSFTDPRTYKLRTDVDAESPLVFYTSFVDPTKQSYTWNGRLPNSFDAFAEEKTAMIFGFSSDRGRILAKNPHLNLGVAAFPQPAQARIPITYGQYFFPTVSRLTQHPVEAWQFLLFAAGKTGAASYLEATQRPPARRDLVAAGSPTDELHVFYRQTLTARSWHIPDEDTARSLFGRTVDLITSGRVPASQTIFDLRERLRLLLP